MQRIGEEQKVVRGLKLLTVTRAFLYSHPSHLDGGRPAAGPAIFLYLT
jgi:hypothetical protein